MALSLRHLVALFSVLAILALDGNIVEAIRPVAPQPARPIEVPKLGKTLATRLHLKVEHEDDNATLCWDTLLERQPCSTEAIVFFLNGTADIDPECCNAIYTIEHHCWPSMLTALGHNSKERNVLHRYCNDSNSGDHSSPSHLEHDHLKDPEMKKNQTLVHKP